MAPHFIVLGALCLAFSAAHATDIYRWVDERGQTQMSDKLPEKYRDVATKTNSGRFELTPEQRAEGEARAAQDRDRAARAKAELDAKEQARERQRIEAEKELAAATPAGGSKQVAAESRNNCDALWKEYLENAGCFNQYRTHNRKTGKSGIKPEAFENCSNTPSPVPACQARAVR